MQYLPEKDYDLPCIDLLSLIFDSELAWTQEDTVLHAEAAIVTNHVTKAEARSWTQRLAHVWRNRFGIGEHGPGKNVVLCASSNQVFLPLIFYSVIAAGGVYSAASASLTPSELAEQMEHGGTDVIVACPETRETVTLAARLCGIPLSRILVLESMGNKRSLSTVADGEDNLMRSMHKLDWERITDAETLEQRLICLLYSSGTTGPPKGVMISNMNMVSEAILPQYMIRAYLARRKDADPNFSFDYRTLAHLPAAHVAGCQGYFSNPAIAGGPVYWMPKFNLPDFLKYCESLKISYLSTVPPIYLLIAKSPLVKDQFKYLVHAQSGAAPMGSELQTLTQKRLGCFVSQTWGLTESTGGFTTMPWDRNDLTGSISPILPNTRVRIVGEDERDADEGSRGEILIKGPIVTKGYFKDPEATANAFTAEGWFRTGDVGLRKNGMFYIVDRKKELIKYKGLQVAPAELEALLLGLEKVQDVAVIGIPDPDGSGNELPRAYVVMGTGPGSLSAEQIKAHVKSNLAQHKQLRGGVVFVDVIPRNASGKILRRKLREDAQRESRRQGQAQPKL